MGFGETGKGLVVVSATVAWLAGAALQMQQAALWPSAGYRTLAAIGLAAVFAPSIASRAGLRAPKRWKSSGHWRLAAFAAGLAAMAFATTGERAAARLADGLSPSLEGVDLVVTGVVATMPEIDADGARFLFEVESAETARFAAAPQQKPTVPRRLRLGWYADRAADPLFAGPHTDVMAGQRWRFTVRLKRPHGTLNPHGFDAELWLFEQCVNATGSVRPAAAVGPRLLAEDAGATVERFRQRLRDRLLLAAGGSRDAGVLAALAVGDQSAIGSGDWDLFRTTGIAHLMSISGLHVTMFAWAAGLLVGRLWRMSAAAMHRLPAGLAARWGGVLAAFGYAQLAGWGVPAQRTVWMLATIALLRSLGLRWPGLAMLGASAWVVCLLDPWALMEPGFWLSFVAVALLMGTPPVSVMADPADALRDEEAALGDQGLPRRTARFASRTLVEAAKTQAVATIGLAPLSILFFQQLSVVGLVANFVAVPLVTLVVTPLAIASLALPALAPLASAAMAPLWRLLDALAASPSALWTMAAPPAWAFALGTIGAVVVLLPLPWRVRGPALLLLLPLVAPNVERPAEGRFELLAADVGQGSAVLVRTHAHLALVDAGPRYTPDADAGSRVLLPLLRARGEPAIDLLVLTHRDADHVGGAAALIAGLPVAAMTSSIEPSHPLRALGVPHRRCEAGQHWRWDGVAFEVLHPATADYDTLAASNAMSCVVRVVDADGRSALITGDIERPQEEALLARNGDGALTSDVLLVPHHGSRTSSSEAFVDAVSPKVAVIQAGYLNRFGHPAPEIVSRYAAHGVAVVRSDRCGAWRWSGERAECTRDVDRRYWQWRPATEAGAPPPPAAAAAPSRSVRKLLNSAPP